MSVKVESEERKTIQRLSLIPKAGGAISVDSEFCSKQIQVSTSGTITLDPDELCSLIDALLDASDKVGVMYRAGWRGAGLR